MAADQPGKRDPKKVTIVADRLRARILSGELKDGAQLPSQAKLKKEFDVSEETARGAIDLLVIEALVQKRHGRQTVVTYRDPVHRLLVEPRGTPTGRVEDSLTAFVRDPKATGSDRVCCEDEVEVPGPFARLLGLEPAGAMTERTIRLEVDGEPVLTSISYLPTELTVGSGQEWHHVEVGELALVGYPVVAGRSRVQARPPSPAERETLGMHRGPALAVLGNRYQVRVDERTVPAGVIVLARGDRVFLERDADQEH